LGNNTYFLDPIFAWHISRDRIFQINEQRGYEILVYGGEGSLVRKIRKQYDPVRMTSETREALLQGIPDNSPLGDSAVSPDHLPPRRRLLCPGQPTCAFRSGSLSHLCIGKKSIFILRRRERKRLPAAEDFPDDLGLENQVLNHFWVRKLIRTSISMTGTSIRTPTTVAKAAPDESPKSMTAVAMATSK
jgi:hypothetical protein